VSWQLQQLVMCDRGRVLTSFSIDDIMQSSNDRHGGDPAPSAASVAAVTSADGRRHMSVPAVVRPWETTTSLMRAGAGGDLRLTAALTTFCQFWHAVSYNVSPLCALYKMTTSNFNNVDSLDANSLRGWKT